MECVKLEEKIKEQGSFGKEDSILEKMDRTNTLEITGGKTRGEGEFFSDQYLEKEGTSKGNKRCSLLA